MNVPQVDFGFIGGSSTLDLEFPEALDLDYVEILDDRIIFTTPYGGSPPFKLLLIHGEGKSRRVLACRMHGWRSGVSRADASRQVFWVFREAKVRKILAEGGVGAINHLLRPRDLVIPNDYIDFSMRKDVGLGDSHLLIMREALCPELRDYISSYCEKEWKEGRVFDRGVYVNTDGRHFESPAEVACFKSAGGDIVGQSLCPEVYLAREIGACYAGLYLVVNYAEGVVSPWQHEELKEIFHEQSREMGRMIYRLLRDIPLQNGCKCTSLRKETLLDKVYIKKDS